MRIILFIVFIISSTALHAQQLHDSLPTHGDNTYIVAEKKHTIIKPVAIAAGYSAVCWATYRYADEPIREFAEDNHNNFLDNTFHVIEFPGLTSASIMIVAGTGVSYLITKNKRFEKATILLTGAHLINGLVTHEIKLSFQRHRPNTGDPYNTFDWRGGPKVNDSFVSGHASDAFATATVFAICFGNKKWVPVVAYSAASLIGLSRIYRDQHWTSDVLAGAAVGFLSAHAMNKLYTIGEKRFSFFPQVDNKYFGASVVYNLR